MCIFDNIEDVFSLFILFFFCSNDRFDRTFRGKCKTAQVALYVSDYRSLTGMMCARMQSNKREAKMCVQHFHLIRPTLLLAMIHLRCVYTLTGMMRDSILHFFYIKNEFLFYRCLKYQINF